MGRRLRHWFKRVVCWWRGHDWWSPDFRHTEVVFKKDPSIQLTKYQHCTYCGLETTEGAFVGCWEGYWDTSEDAYSPNVDFISLIPPKPIPLTADQVWPLAKKGCVKKYRSIDDE